MLSFSKFSLIAFKTLCITIITKTLEIVDIIFLNSLPNNPYILLKTFLLSTCPFIALFKSVFRSSS